MFKKKKLTFSNKIESKFYVWASLIINVPFSGVAANVNEKLQFRKQLYSKIIFVFYIYFRIYTYRDKRFAHLLNLPKRRVLNRL